MANPHHLLILARQMEDQRRQREQDALQQQLMLQSQKDRAAQEEDKRLGQATSLIGKMGVQQIFTVYPELTARSVAVITALDKDKKKQEKKAKTASDEGPASSAIGAQLPFMAQMVPGGNVNSPEYANLVSGLAQTGLSPDTLSPLMQQLSTQVQLGPISAASKRGAALESLNQTGDVERLKAGIDVEKQRKITADRLSMERFAGQVHEADQAKTDIYADRLADAYMRASEDPQGLTRVLLSIQDGMSNPAIEMPPVQAKANAIMAASTDARAIADNFKQMGYQVPLSMAKAVSENKAAIDEYTGLISIDPGKNGAQQRQSRASSMTLITQLKAVAQRMADGPMRGMGTAERLAWATAQAAKYEVGTADPLYTDYRNRKGPLSFSMARATFTGTMANQERQAMDKLFADPRMIAGGKAGRLNPQAESIFAALYANVESGYRVATPRGPFPNEQLRSVLEKRKQEDLDSFRSSYLDTQYPSAPDAQGWEPGN